MPESNTRAGQSLREYEFGPKGGLARFRWKFGESGAALRSVPR